jgi:hypothetical protein
VTTHPAGTTRRRMLSASVLAALAAGTGGLAGCTAEPSPWAKPPKPSPDVKVLHDVISAEYLMISKYTAVLAAFPRLAGSMSPLLAQHREHLTALQARLVIPSGASPAQVASATARPRAPRPRVPSSRPAAIGYLRAAERDQAAALAHRVAGVPPSLAQLLASIGACEAAHAALLGSAGERR